MISVIVPVYNMEKYVKRCIDSIINQCFDDFEVILVDDGSTDLSGNICDEYANKFERVSAYHKKNRGLSHTRNYGVQKAKGDYITFVDSDDYIAKDYLQVLYDLLKANNCSIACGNFKFFDDSTLNKSIKKIKRRDLLYTGEEACISLLYGRKFYTSSCCILLEKEIVVNNSFPIGKYHEDELTTFRYFLNAKKVAITNMPLYYYYQREGSIMHRYGQPVIDQIDAAFNYVEVCKVYNNRIQKASINRRYSLLREVLNNYPLLEKQDSEHYNIVVKKLEQDKWRILFDIKSGIVNKKYACMKVLHS